MSERVESRLLTVAEQEEAAKQRLRGEERRRRWHRRGEWVGFAALLFGSAAVLVMAYWKTEEMLRQPISFPYGLQYATAEARKLDYVLDFGDESQIPAAARRTPKPERKVPYIVVSNTPGHAVFEPTTAPAEQQMKLVVPMGVQPGDWRGLLRFKTSEGAEIASMPIAFHVADPYRLYWIGGSGFILFSCIWYFGTLYIRPPLRAWVLWMDLTRYERRNAPDPHKMEFGTGWFDRFIALPNRHRVPLSEIHPRMPQGRLIAVRRGLLSGKKRIWLKLELDGVEVTPLVLSHHWPGSTRDISQLGGRPAARIDIPTRGAFNGQPWCIVCPPDEEGNALAFSILHRESNPNV